MNIEDIQKFLDNKTSPQKEYVKINFKKRDTICGIFIKGHRDYSYLKSKNFWRIVPERHFAAYQKSGDIQLAKIFCGAEFTRLTLAITAVE
jgi:hypothetical protein